MFASPSSVTTSTRSQEGQPAPDRRPVLSALSGLLHVRRAVARAPLSTGRTMNPPAINHLHPFV